MEVAEEEEAAGSLLVSKQEKLQWREEAGRLGGTQEMTGTEQLTAVTQKQNYTLHTLKEGVSFSTHLRVSQRDGGTFLIDTCRAEIKSSKHSRMRVEKAPPV